MFTLYDWIMAKYIYSLFLRIFYLLCDLLVL